MEIETQQCLFLVLQGSKTKSSWVRGRELKSQLRVLGSEKLSEGVAGEERSGEVRWE